MNKIYLGLGSDTGDRIKHIAEAVRKIEESIGMIISNSRVYETESWGFESDNRFLNQVFEVETALNPSGLLGRILMIEASLGRIRTGSGYASRIIDIDILFFGDEIIREAELIIPHPHLHERNFVLVPLNEIAPEFVHPVLKKEVRRLLKECSDKSHVEIYS